MTVVAYDPVKNKTYRATSLGRDVAAFLDWKELGGAEAAAAASTALYVANQRGMA